MNALAVAGPASRYKQAESAPAGFWHGWIAPVVFLASLLTPKVRIYETANRGRSYDLGFLVGLSVFSGVGVSIGDFSIESSNFRLVLHTGPTA